MPSLTPSQMDEFLQAPRHAILATNRAGKPPQISPVWYVYEDGHVYISIGAGTAKHHNMKRDPQVSVCVDGCHPDARAVMIYGTAELIEGDDPLRQEMRWRIIQHYHESEEAARRYFEQIRDTPSALVIITPGRIISQDFN